jgi:UDP-glucose:(heptosyl)LPS alpha-1,3-glucosyltransferase
LGLIIFVILQKHMKLAFCLFNYFPYGGLQRDFIRIARICRQRGHDIHVYTMRWEGDVEPDFKLHLIEAKGWQNHTRSLQFSDKLQFALAAGRYDLVIGFNKMPHLDMYYAADVCYQMRMAKQRSAFYRLLPRYRQLVAFEEAVFARGNKTAILLISPHQQQEFVHCYQTETERFHLLTPGIAKDRIAPANALDIRAAMRASYQLRADDVLLLSVGSGFKTKGLDRSIRGLAAMPAALKKRTRLFVIGKDNPRIFMKLAKQLGVAQQVYFLGGRFDVPNFLLAADLLLHPAYHENTGTVLLEALASGLPVLTLDTCGYAHYVNEANAGLVLNSPFQQAEFNDALQKMILSEQRKSWQDNGLAFAKRADIYSLPEKTADLIDHVVNTRSGSFLGV